MNQDRDSPAPFSKTRETADEIRFALSEILDIPEEEILPSSRFDAIIERPIRRQVWEVLRAWNLPLPPLGLTSGAFLGVAFVVLAPLALLAFLVHWSVLLSLAEISMLARWVTRPWAVHPPDDCQTIREAAISITPFRLDDYRAGLWPREEIAAKVRMLVARTACVPLSSVKDDSRLMDLFTC
jgi:hypothetical protein